MYSDKTLSCKDCGAEFAFTAAEQEFYSEKGFTNEPGRCPACRAARKDQSRGGARGGYGQSDRQMHEATCATCGKIAMVPFKPSNDRPVYCKECYTPQPRRNSW
ncbi:MAG: zinc-ribbon domain containing protein [Acidobacteriota bacterium]